jgi:uncharacterized integral membrane protein
LFSKYEWPLTLIALLAILSVSLMAQRLENIEFPFFFKLLGK